MIDRDFPAIGAGGPQRLKLGLLRTIIAPDRLHPKGQGECNRQHQGQKNQQFKLRTDRGELLRTDPRIAMICVDQLPRSEV